MSFTRQSIALFELTSDSEGHGDKIIEILDAEHIEDDLAPTSIMEVTEETLREKPPKKEDEENVECPICMKTVLPASLKSHMVTHDSRSRFPCEICGDSFTRRSDVGRHIRTVHTVEPQEYTCSICTKGFKHKTAHKRHMSMHKAGKVCPVCNCIFTKSEYIQNHMKFLHPEYSSKPGESPVKAVNIEKSDISMVVDVPRNATSDQARAAAAKTAACDSEKMISDIKEANRGMLDVQVTLNKLVPTTTLQIQVSFVSEEKPFRYLIDVPEGVVVDGKSENGKRFLVNLINDVVRDKVFEGPVSVVLKRSYAKD